MFGVSWVKKLHDHPRHPTNHSNNCEACVSFMPIAAWNKLIQLLKDIISQRFYGTFEIRFEDGIIVNFRKTENIKP